MRYEKLGSAPRVSRVGQGSWYVEQADWAQSVAAFQAGLDAGMNHIDTAEMYGDGQAETLIGQALQGRRHEAFLVSKVLPFNASRQGVIRACEASLKRLGIDVIDLYYVHRIDPDVLKASKQARNRTKPKRPERLVDTSCATVGPFGCTSTGIDLLMGIGGTPEGIIAACAMKCMGGVIQGRLWPTDDAERERAIEAGVVSDDQVRRAGIDEPARKAAGAVRYLVAPVRAPMQGSDGEITFPLDRVHAFDDQCCTVRGKIRQQRHARPVWVRPLGVRR